MKIPKKVYATAGVLLFAGCVFAAYNIGLSRGTAKTSTVENRTTTVDGPQKPVPIIETPKPDIALPDPVPDPNPVSPWQVSARLAPHDQTIDKGYIGYFWKNQILERTDFATSFDIWCVFEYPNKRTETKLMGRFNIIGNVSPNPTITGDACARLR